MDDASGHFSVRIPKELHSKLVEQAQEEGCSLNQLVTLYLSQAVTMHECAGWIDRYFNNMATLP